MEDNQAVSEEANYVEIKARENISNRTRRANTGKVFERHEMEI